MKKIVLLLALSFAFSNFSLAAIRCDQVLSSAESVLNEMMTTKYPELAFITQNPEAFVKSVQDRYEVQRKQDPTRPLDFDYAAESLPTIQYALGGLKDKLTEIGALHAQKQQILQNTSAVRALKIRQLKIDLREMEIAQEFYRDLITEASTYVHTGQVNYRRSNEFFYYYGRAMGHFETREMTPLTRLYLSIDRAFQGYKPLPIEVEYQNYRERRFLIFQKNSSLKSFRVAENIYLEALQHTVPNPQETRLKAILVPVYQNIDRDILMRMLPKEISIIGMSNPSVAADGFYRPSGDFRMHDIRHESVRFYEMALYMEKHDLTYEQWKKIGQLQEKWYLQLHNQMQEVADPDLKAAIDLVSFNYFHDRGFPLIPSVWAARDKPYILKGLLLMLTLSGQGVGYKNVLSTTTKASAWLDDFWGQRLNEELDFLQALED